MADESEGARRPTVHEVAKEAGVSIATVSYVLADRALRPNGGRRYSVETATRVKAAAERLRYRPNPSAQAVRTGRTGVVQLSLHMLSDPWALAVADSVNAAAKARGLTTMILADGDWADALERQPTDVAFIDISPGTPDSPERLARLVERGQRLVVFSDTLEPDGFDVVRSAAVPGCYLAVGHLLQGHSRIGCLTSTSARHATGASRFTPYVELLGAAGLPVREEWIEEFTDSNESAYLAAAQLLSRPDRPSALYATTDFAALAAVNAAHRLGLRIPEDVAIIGVGNTVAGEHSDPTLSTVGPSDFYARVADIIVGKALAPTADDGRLHDFPWSLIVRASTAGEGEA
ncbi:LacI family DNA-binding transcriptional regulator [uncultured Leifsonia sp.]|uniref:LacI family DNA-binding transcriptional regulator n=1 Tax=uncultured Leifsonia sp. TaxID=340359 RepID=UPI0028D42FA0|nr:LacI family DNA-binding transcriptional regulator [uncultured Leifsonia sp.]